MRNSNILFRCVLIVFSFVLCFLLCGCQTAFPLFSKVPEGVVPVDLDFTCRSYYGGIPDQEPVSVHIVGELWPQSSGGVKVQIDISDHYRWYWMNGGGSMFRHDWEATPLPYVFIKGYLMDKTDPSDQSHDGVVCVFCPEKGYIYLDFTLFPNTYLVGSVEPDVPEEEILEYFSEFLSIYRMDNLT